MAIIYAQTFEKHFDQTTFLFAFLGILFVIIGNYLPKCKQNHTIGIKIVWTLNNEENWNATHRISGKIWVIGGLCTIVCLFLPIEIVPYLLLPIFLMMIIIPILYSYIYYRKQRKSGKITKDDI